MDSRTPVLVGVAAVSQREEDPARADEALELMARALEAAAGDAGAPALLAEADAIRAPRGFWAYGDPGSALAERFGAHVRTQVAEVGVLQTTAFGRAAADIAAGKADIVLLTGAEAKYRSLRAQITGTAVEDSEAPGEPDEVLRPATEIMSPLEVQHGLGMPAAQYAMIDNALRAAEGLDVDAHRDELAALWAGMSAVAADNPDAWNRSRVDADTIRGHAGGRNRMIAFPYTKLHNSQWNVDQAAGLILCSLARAKTLGVPDDRIVYPLAVADNNTMVTLSERAELHRSPGFQHAGRAAYQAAGIGPDEIAFRELYSCFPSAVRVQQRELGLDPALPVSLTGGMTFGGGPLNNFVLQALVKMAQTLRATPGSIGMVNAVSGLLTKQGVSLWASRPGDARVRTRRCQRGHGCEHGHGSGRCRRARDPDGSRPTRSRSKETRLRGRRPSSNSLREVATVASSTASEICDAFLAGEGCRPQRRRGARRPPPDVSRDEETRNPQPIPSSFSPEKNRLGLSSVNASMTSSPTPASRSLGHHFRTEVQRMAHLGHRPGHGRIRERRTAPAPDRVVRDDDTIARAHPDQGDQGPPPARHRDAPAPARTGRSRDRSHRAPGSCDSRDRWCRTSAR